MHMTVCKVQLCTPRLPLPINLRLYSSPSYMLAITKAVTTACTVNWTAAATAVS
jgi:hypothetical protein